ncbi:MAG TPA: GNAT family N-acetyltransferase [bacterium]
MREILSYRLPDATQVTLRPAGPEDAAGIIAAVRSRSDERSYVLMEIYGKDAAAERAYLEKLDRSRNLFLVAVVAGKVVGVLALLDMPLCAAKGDAAAAGVHLVPEWRGHGIGSTMLRYAVRWAVAHGFKRIEADIFTANDRSLHLFRNARFHEEPCQRRSVQVGARKINEVVLTRRLSAGGPRA